MPYPGSMLDPTFEEIMKTVRESVGPWTRQAMAPPAPTTGTSGTGGSAGAKAPAVQQFFGNATDPAHGPVYRATQKPPTPIPPPAPNHLWANNMAPEAPPSKPVMGFNDPGSEYYAKNPQGFLEAVRWNPESRSFARQNAIPPAPYAPGQIPTGENYPSYENPFPTATQRAYGIPAPDNTLARETPGDMVFRKTPEGMYEGIRYNRSGNPDIQGGGWDKFNPGMVFDYQNDSWVRSAIPTREQSLVPEGEVPMQGVYRIGPGGQAIPSSLDQFNKTAAGPYSGTDLGPVEMIQGAGSAGQGRSAYQWNPQAGRMQDVTPWEQKFPKTYAEGQAKAEAAGIPAFAKIEAEKIKALAKTDPQAARLAVFTKIATMNPYLPEEKIKSLAETAWQFVINNQNPERPTAPPPQGAQGARPVPGQREGQETVWNGIPLVWRKDPATGQYTWFEK